MDQYGNWKNRWFFFQIRNIGISVGSPPSSFPYDVRTNAIFVQNSSEKNRIFLLFSHLFFLSFPGKRAKKNSIFGKEDKKMVQSRSVFISCVAVSGAHFTQNQDMLLYGDLKELSSSMNRWHFVCVCEDKVTCKLSSFVLF